MGEPMLQILKAKTLYDNNIKYYLINEFQDIKVNDIYVGETCFGEDIVQITCNKIIELSQEKWDALVGGSDKKEIKKSHFSFEPQLIRKAHKHEIENYHENQKVAQTYKDVFVQKIKEYNIELKIVYLHYTLAKDRLICIYTAPRRIDFREFVRDLGSTLRQRIELFQILAQVLLCSGGEIGVCGRCLCCTTFCSEKIKTLPTESIVRSNKNIGCCGRVKCCSVFEQDYKK